MGHSKLDAIRAAMRSNAIADEDEAVKRLTGLAALDGEARAAVSARAAGLVDAVRGAGDPAMMESFLAEYGLSSREGVALMCLAEALLRVPDAATMDELIRDKIAPHDWSAHSGGSASGFVNASTWALMLTGRVLDDGEGAIEKTLRGMIRRLGEPVIRAAVSAAMREMGDQFVLGRTIEEAEKRGRPMLAKGYLYSYDMLGEAARTRADAARYHAAYLDAIMALKGFAKSDDIRANPGISVKLSALHPRYEILKRQTMLPEMAASLLALALAAKQARMGLNIDAEEADRLDISLDVIESVLADPQLDGWDGFGVVVQAYGPRAPYVIDWLHALAEKLDRKIMVRLVKGAYWDTEIKRAQTLGLPGFPVFTRKVNTDISYIACARKLLGMTGRIYPQFATHNAHTAAAILAMGADRWAFEFQRLHGMGEALHEAIRKTEGTRCRIYAPVGAHADLLAYLVRRLLENGANSSFVHQIADKSVGADVIASDPFALAERHDTAANPAILTSARLFGASRRNSAGFDITDPLVLERIVAARAPFLAPHVWSASPAAKAGAVRREMHNPANPGEIVGHVDEARADHVGPAVSAALAAQPGWEAQGAAARAAILLKAADLFEAAHGEVFALAAREAGKTLADCVAELREAVDFLRYYAGEAPKHSGAARGVIVCISPWNFPLAIFTGQVAAALATGNAVIAKPAEQTPLMAALAVRLLQQAGVPEGALQLLPGDGPSVGAPLCADPRIGGVCFTGSTEVARLIERQLAKTASPDAMLIAETGGLNAMIVDSTALPEQAVRDILASAFQSAGQRCSALRVVYIQKDVEGKVLDMLEGAMADLALGDPLDPASDVGPLIDQDALTGIGAYCAETAADGREIAALATPGSGLFLGPRMVRVSGISGMEREIFGPVLHVASFEADEIGEVIKGINAKGYGLTFGLHTRIEVRVQTIIDSVAAGNVYVNRNQIGAVVGAQPFGGEGLSGTGPKAGGPHYLERFLRPKPLAPAALSGRIVTAAELDKAWPDNAAWAVRGDRLEVLRRALRGRASDAIAAVSAIDFGPVDLPGPTGEANTLALMPRGRALCLGPAGETLLAQTVLALACGNTVVAIAPGAAADLKVLLGLGLPLAVLDGQIAPETLADAPVDCVAASLDAAAPGELRRALSRRNGPLVRLVTGLEPTAFTVERSVSVDTTAAGGNASLLAASV